MEKYKGIFPAFYACYDEKNEVSPEAVKVLAEHFLAKGVKGLYVGGSSGECIYQSTKDRMTVLESLMSVVRDKMTIIAHVACNNTADSQLLASHAESLGVDAIASIPPIYFHLPDYAIAKYWNDISAAAPNTDFIIYNIPQLAGVRLSSSLYEEMLQNPLVKGVKNSSDGVADIENFCAIGGENKIVYNGPDEHLLSGLRAGAGGGIGGTYGVMPEIYMSIYEAFKRGESERAKELQRFAFSIISEMLQAKGNLYAVLKAVLKKQGVDIGGVRPPLPPLFEGDFAIVDSVAERIEAKIKEL